MSAMGPMAGPPPQMLPLPPGAGQGGPGPGGLGPGGPPGGPGGPSPAPQPGEEAAEAVHLHAAAAAIQQAVDVETDPSDRAALAKIHSDILKIVANRDNEKQAAMGTSPALKLALRQSR